MPLSWRSLLALLAVLAGLATLLLPSLRLGFWNADDWLHLDIASGLREGLRPAWVLAIRGPAAADALRVVPALTWVLDEAIWGLDARPYYATNLAVVLATAGLLWDLARRLSGSVAAASVAAVLWGTHPAVIELVAFLSAREDGIALMLTALSLDLWLARGTTARGRRLGAVVLALALGSKVVAASALPAILIHGGAEGRPLRDTRPLFIGVAVWMVLLVFAIGDRWPHVAGKIGGGWEAAAVVQRIEAILRPAPLAMGLPAELADFRWAVVVLAAAVVGLLIGSGSRPTIRLAAAWALGSLVIPAPWLVKMVNPGDIGWRYLAMPLAAGAVGVAGCLGRDPGSGWRRMVRGVLLVSILAAPIIQAASVFPVALTRYGMACNMLVPAVLATARDEARTARGQVLVVEVQRPDGDLAAALSSPHLARRVEEAGAKLRVALRGSPVLLSPRIERFGYGRFHPSPGPDPRTERPYLVDDPATAPRVSLQRARPAAPSLPSAPGMPTGHWRGHSPAFVSDPGGGWIGRGGFLAEARLEGNDPWFGGPGGPSLTGTIFRPSGGLCGVRLSVSFDEPPQVEQPRDEVFIPSGLFAVLGWSNSPEGPHPWLVVPLARTVGTQDVDILGWQHPAWPKDGGKLDLRLTIANSPTPMQVVGLDPLPCRP